MKPTTPTLEFIVSAGNNPYQLWQSMLFHYSCWKHQGRAPLIVVHSGEDPLLDGFEKIVAAGGRVQPAPDFSQQDSFTYLPRNTPAALKYAKTEADYVVLCEPDMVFLQPLAVEQIALSPHRITFDRITYLEPDRKEYQPALDEVCRQSGLNPQVLRTLPLNGGVPHILSTGKKREFSDHWLHGLKLFVDLARQGVDTHPREAEIHWVSGMWSTVLAVHLMRLKPVMTDLCISNQHGSLPLPIVNRRGPTIIHYCYGNETFNKRDYLECDDARRRVWRVPPDDGTINGAIRGQLNEAREFYGL